MSTVLINYCSLPTFSVVASLKFEAHRSSIFNRGGARLSKQDDLGGPDWGRGARFRLEYDVEMGAVHYVRPSNKFRMSVLLKLALPPIRKIILL